MKNKKGLEFGFSWIFAVLVGAVILFLAIYAAVKMVGTSRYEQDTLTAKQLTIIFEPLETGIASGYKPETVNLKEETRIYNICRDDGSFGRQEISLASSSGFVKKWQKPGVSIKIPNKYIFSNGTEQGRKIYYFSKPFNMPWKVSELIFLTTEEYCFVNAPNIVENDILDLDLENIDIENCSDNKNYIKVCFGQSGCDINVYGSCDNEDCLSLYDYGYISKNGKSLYYSDSLMYAAIFSSPEIYACNVKRLMKRLTQQALLLGDEADFISDKCGSSVSIGVLRIAITSRINNTNELISVYSAGKEADAANKAGECQLW